MEFTELRAQGSWLNKVIATGLKESRASPTDKDLGGWSVLSFHIQNFPHRDLPSRGGSGAEMGDEDFQQHQRSEGTLHAASTETPGWSSWCSHFCLSTLPLCKSPHRLAHQLTLHGPQNKFPGLKSMVTSLGTHMGVSCITRLAGGLEAPVDLLSLRGNRAVFALPTTI